MAFQIAHVFNVPLDDVLRSNPQDVERQDISDPVRPRSPGTAPAAPARPRRQERSSAHPRPDARPLSLHGEAAERCWEHFAADHSIGTSLADVQRRARRRATTRPARRWSPAGHERLRRTRGADLVFELEGWTRGPPRSSRRGTGRGAVVDGRGSEVAGARSAPTDPSPAAPRTRRRAPGARRAGRPAGPAETARVDNQGCGRDQACGRPDGDEQDPERSRRE